MVYRSPGDTNNGVQDRGQPLPFLAATVLFQLDAVLPLLSLGAVALLRLSPPKVMKIQAVTTTLLDPRFYTFFSLYDFLFVSFSLYLSRSLSLHLKSVFCCLTENSIDAV